MNKKEDNLLKTIKHLKKKKNILFLTTSNRWSGQKEEPKSTLLAKHLAKIVKAKVIEIPKLNIHPCEGNVSTKDGNQCGLKKAVLKDKQKNPSGQHRCWASLNNKNDELWKVSKELLKSDCVIIFSSVRWGQLNSYYQKLIERLTWLENRHTTLGESNLLKKIDAGLIVIGQNWNGSKAMHTQKKVLGYYGFNVIDNLCWNWQYTSVLNDETPESYQKSFPVFERKFLKQNENPKN
jgi:multimeric flavodoxin WrbA